MFRITTLFSVLLLLAAPAFAGDGVKVVNKSGGTVRVKVWSGVTFKTKTLANGKSFVWNRNSTKPFHVRVFKKEGKLVKVWKKKKTLKNVDYSQDVIIARGLKIKTTRVRHTTIRNGSSKALVVYVYKGKDDIRLFSKESFTIQPGKSATWKSTESRFHVKAYELKKGFNRHVGTQVDISGPSDVTITDKGGWSIAAKKK